MANQQLLDYIQESLRSGISERQIRSVLLQQGWGNNEVNQAFIEINGSKNFQPLTMTVSNKNLFLKILIGIVIVVIFGTASYLVFRGNKQAVEINLPGAYGENKYKNNLLGYEISFKDPWRVAVDFTKRYALISKLSWLLEEVGCKEDSIGFDECLAKYPEVDQRFNEFQKAWNINESEIVILTDLTKEQEKDFVQEIINNKKTILDFPADHAIQIYPTERDDMRFCGLKETSTGSKSKIKAQFYNLTDGTRTCRTDWRATEFTRTGRIADALSLDISVQHEFTYKTISGGTAVALLFRVVDAEPASKLEQTFYEIVNSVKFLQ